MKGVLTMSWDVYKCNLCGKVIAVLNGVPTPTICCGEKMVKLVAGTTDAATEKHVPAVTVDGNTVTVKVGSVEHPMMDAHYIQFIAINTSNGGQIKYLTPADKPEAVFTLGDGDEFISAIEYCNLHGLWEGK
ncbi:MAG: desulfoferrodoxin [Eubacterium sp.]|nr:desulfoferrodoxin [Eubacterium sp.]